MCAMTANYVFHLVDHQGLMLGVLLQVDYFFP
jgi:hypothetical protein